jgi:hypothetical protein
MAELINEVYDEKGNISIQYIEVEDDNTIEFQISKKEDELIKIYYEIQELIKLKSAKQ